MAADVNSIRLEESSYDLIYAVQSFHHFENFEHLFAEIHRALRPGGFCVLEEYVGPKRFQWTDTQLALIRHILGIMPLHLRMYAKGMEKNQEGRSTVEEVIQFCPSEAIRSDEIVPFFHRTFDVVHYNKLGGTIQHLLYSGIIHNFPDDDPATDHLIDSIDALESAFIEGGVIASDFALLVGRKRESGAIEPPVHSSRGTSQ
jgi:SAM-dependent methyltransferase